MKITTKNLSDTRVELTVKLDAADLKPAETKALARLAQEVKLAGFRKGKVPAEIAAKHINPNDLATATLDLAVRLSIPEAFAQADKQPLMMPEVEVTKFVPEQTLEYKATADILPEIKLGNFKNLKVKLDATKATDQEVEEVLANIQASYAEKKAAKKAAALGDEVVIDFEGAKDGVKFDGGAAKDFRLLLGSGQFIPGFEDGVVGHTAGERFELKLTFPKDYHNKDLAGAKTVFSVLLKQVNAVTKPELNDALAQKCGPFKTLADLKADIKQNLQAQNDHKAQEKYKDELVSALVKGSKVSAPAVLVQDQLNFIKQDITRNAQAQGLTFDDYLKQVDQTLSDWEKEASKIAEIRVKSSLCLQTLAKEQQITISDQAVEDKVRELREIYKKSPEALKNLKEAGVKANIRNRLAIEAAINFLVEANK